MTDAERVAYLTTVLLESKWARRQQQPEDERDHDDLTVSVQEISELLQLPRSVVVQSLAEFGGVLGASENGNGGAPDAI